MLAKMCKFQILKFTQGISYMEDSAAKVFTTFGGFFLMASFQTPICIEVNDFMIV